MRAQLLRLVTGSLVRLKNSDRFLKLYYLLELGNEELKI